MLTSDMFKGFIPTVLMIIIPVLIIAAIVSVIRALLSPTKKQQDYKYQKRNLLTNSELAFYKSLFQIATKKGLITLTKVRLADLIEPQKGTNNWQGSFSKISQKHVDFVLCDNVKINPILIIELDDKTHDRADRQQRDTFVDQALLSAGIPILHAKNSDKLEENIMKLLSPKTTSIK